MIPQRILVTGGAGFIGSHTADLLLKHDNQVLILDNLSSGKLTNLNVNHPHLEFIEGDVLEYFLIEDLIRQCDAVLHLAAIASVSETIENPLYSLQVNTLGFLHILQAVLKVNPGMPIVYASSAAVYGDEKNLPCRDDQVLTAPALSPYSLQKIQAEQYADLYLRLYGIKSLALRYFNVYGERQDPNSPYSGVISRFMNAYQNDETLTIFGDGKQSRDFIHISDVANANLLALQACGPGVAGVMNIGTGIPETLLSLIKVIETKDKPAKINFQPARVGDIYSSYASVASAKNQLGFTAEMSLAEGVKRLQAGLHGE